MNLLKTELVVKSNRLIEASYKLSMLEQQIILLAVVRAREGNKGILKCDPALISVKDFAQTYSLSLSCGSIYDNIKGSVETLFERYVTINDKDPRTGSERTGKVRWISEAWYTKADATISLVFSPSIIPYIMALQEQYTSYEIKQIGALTSVYAVRMYELIGQFRSTGIRHLEIERLRDMLGLIDEYKLFGDFKKRVLDVAVEQINEHTDLKFSYKTRKTGRRITHLDFSIKEKSAIVSKRPKLDKAYIDANALTGETYEQARIRLANLRDAKK
jgi:plasmid replication initiation protein